MLDRGCESAGYRLSGSQLEHVCCRHLYGNDRLLTVWPGTDHVVVLAVGPHDRSSGDLYAQLLRALDIEVPDPGRSKPPCCDEAGAPPGDAEAASAIVAAMEGVARRRRRGRPR